MLKYSAFSLSVVDSLGDTALAYTLTAIRWAVLGYDFVTSDKAQATYKWVGQMTLALGQLAFWSVVWAYAKTTEGAEADVTSCLYVDANDYEIDYQADYGISDQIWNTDPDTMAPSLSHEDYLDRKLELEDMTLKALVPLAADLNLVTRKVRKGVLVAAILEAEGYKA